MSTNEFRPGDRIRIVDTYEVTVEHADNGYIRGVDSLSWNLARVSRPSARGGVRTVERVEDPRRLAPAPRLRSATPDTALVMRELARQTDISPIARNTIVSLCDALDVERARTTAPSRVTVSVDVDSDEFAAAVRKAVRGLGRTGGLL